MFVTNWISTTKIQKISEITNFFRHYFLSRTEVFYTSETEKEHEKDTTGQDQYKRYQQDMHHDTRQGERPPEGRALPTHLR